MVCMRKSACFSIPIRNANTRAAYYRVAYIEILQRRAAPPTVKQHMAAIRMLFSWLTGKGDPGTGPGSQDREIFTDRGQDAGIRRR